MRPELTLKEVRKSPKLQQGNPRVSDFLTEEQKEARKLARSNRRDSYSSARFDSVDSYIAEIIARFGYDVYERWDRYEIDNDKMQRMLYAERAREKAQILPLETIIAHLVKDCIRRSKKEKKPTGPKEASKILKEEARIAKGEM